MTEKQRWLLNDVEEWQKARLVEIGKYSPQVEGALPAEVRKARRVVIAAQRIIDRYEHQQDALWRQRKQRVADRVKAVRRVILFESPADALRAVKQLVKG